MQSSKSGAERGVTIALSHAAVGNCGSLDLSASQEKAAKSGPWSGHLTVSKVLGLFGLRHVGIDQAPLKRATSGLSRC